MPGKGRPFKKGHKLAPGGTRPGAGRPPNWFRVAAREVMERSALLEHLEKIATGHAEIVTSIGSGKKKIRHIIKPSFRDQIMAFDKIAHIGIPQNAEVETRAKISWSELTKQAEEERGLSSV